MKEKQPNKIQRLTISIEFDSHNKMVDTLNLIYLNVKNGSVCGSFPLSTYKIEPIDYEYTINNELRVIDGKVCEIIQSKMNDE